MNPHRVKTGIRFAMHGTGAKRRRRLDSLSNSVLRRIHLDVVEGAAKVQHLLQRACLEHCELYAGVDRKSATRTARILSVRQDLLQLDAPNIAAEGQPQIYLRFEVSGRRYFFASPPISGGGDHPLHLEIPAAIYETERRELDRVPCSDRKRARLTLSRRDGPESFEAYLRDSSYHGLGLALQHAASIQIGDKLVINFLDGERAGERLHGTVRHRPPNEDVNGWINVGLEVSAVELGPRFPVERRDTILDESASRGARRRLSLATAMVRSLPSRRLRKKAEVLKDQGDLELVAYKNSRGEEIRGIVDRAVGGKGGVGILIPPAWGRTKETSVALARTIVANFEAIGEPATVLRFDGTNRRGESYVDPECRAPGNEYHHFRFSNAVLDIDASLNFLKDRRDITPHTILIVTFSLGAIEARRAIALDGGRRVGGWVSVVGLVDLQSALRAVSGGVDYFFGLARGVQFGRQELVGVIADIDLSGRDALNHNLVYLEDAKRDMASIEVPVSWLHGRHDGWMELERVRTLLAAGPPKGRRLLEIPVGHQMRSSREALETFQLVSSELIRMTTGKLFETIAPDLGALDLRTRSERARRPAPDFDAPAFWSDYLLGRDRKIGFELLSATTAYRRLMALQIDRLCISSGQRVFDLGSGTGDFPLQLAEIGAPQDIGVTQLDLVPGALSRARSRILRHAVPFSVDHVATDLELSGTTIPFSPCVADSVLASLLLSYVEHPERLLCSIWELLRPGGLLVLSSLKRDADISQIYVESIAELPPDRRVAHFGKNDENFDEIQRVFLNDAARLLWLEEAGRFRFWDAEELRAMCQKAGFVVTSIDAAFGSPPQAVVVTARRVAD